MKLNELFGLLILAVTLIEACLLGLFIISHYGITDWVSAVLVLIVSVVIGYVPLLSLTVLTIGLLLSWLVVPSTYFLNWLVRPNWHNISLKEEE